MNPKTPVIVGVGQVLNRSKDLEEAVDSNSLLKELSAKYPNLKADDIIISKTKDGK